MEEEMVKVCFLTTTSLSYTYFISSKLPKGIIRLFSLLPVFCIFFVIPLSISSINIRGLTAFFLVWLASFKLVLFAFDQGPLSPLPPNIFHFFSICCLPIKIKQNSSPNHTSQQNPPSHFIKKLLNSVWFLVKVVAVLMIMRSFKYRESMHPNTVLFMYCVFLYLELEVVQGLVITPAQAVFQFEIEPQFNEPYLATSLQDFWGCRWNLMVPGVLRPTVFVPVRRILTPLVGPNRAPVFGIFATFVVSGIMHEIIYYYLTNSYPTGEAMGFFLLHGTCLVLEVAMKKLINGKRELKLHRVISGPLVLGFVMVTAVWILLAPLMRNGVDEKAIREYLIALDFVNDKLDAFIF